MTDNSSIASIKESLDKYVYDNLYTIDSINIQFEGLPFNETKVSEWITPLILDINHVYLRQGSSTEYAEESNILFQFNIFVKKSNITKSHRHYIIRDIINSYFKIGQDISIYENGNLTGSMRVRSKVTDSSLPETNELIQYALAYEIDYTKLTSLAVIKLLTEDFDYLITEDGDYLIKEDYRR